MKSTITLFMARFILTITTFSISSSAFGAEAPLSEPVKVKLKVIAPRRFCDAVAREFANYASSQGVDSRAVLRFASTASQTVLSQIGNGNLDPYFDATFLTRSKTIEQSKHVWINASDVVTNAMGVRPKNVLVVTETNDLKMVSQVAPGAQILLIASSLGVLNAERAHLVADAARFGKIQINIIWVGRENARKDQNVTGALSFLAGATDGAFVDLSNRNACSGV